MYAVQQLRAQQPPKPEFVPTPSNFTYDTGFDTTPSELEEFTSRWLIARLLDTKKSYREIASQTGASTTTIGRVARFIKYGNNGYKTILERTK